MNFDIYVLLAALAAWSVHDEISVPFSSLHYPPYGTQTRKDLTGHDDRWWKMHGDSARHKSGDNTKNNEYFLHEDSPFGCEQCLF